MSPYHEMFQSWDDVVNEFKITGDEAKKPDRVFYAFYDYVDYSGDAEVIYRRGSKFYAVSGGHCSCYGLEGQWEPTEYPSADAMIQCLKRETRYGRELGEQIFTDIRRSAGQIE